MHTAICVGLRLTDLMRVMNALIIKKSYMMKRVLIYCMKNLTKMAKLGNLFFLSPIHNAYKPTVDHLGLFKRTLQGVGDFGTRYAYI